MVSGSNLQGNITFAVPANQGNPSKTPQYVNAVISSIVTVAVGLALQKDVPEALIVFGAWAIGTGLIQFILGCAAENI